MAELDAYEQKRRAGRTPEPFPAPARDPAESVEKARTPAGAKPSTSSKPIFVIHEHHATSLHWDFRLERDDVLVSWALPKGLPLDPRRNRLAVHVEDHPLEYATFGGEIPKGEYGGGTVSIWDTGTYDTEKWTEREVMVDLHGTRATGRYVLFKTGTGAAENWMIHRMDPAPSGFEAMPTLIRPMLAEPGSLPSDDRGWSYEIKWDGLRAIVYVDGGRIRIVTRNDRTVTDSYPELRSIGERLGTTTAVLDGEIVAFDDAGRPNFGRLQQRMNVSDGRKARRLAERDPVSYMVFDVLYLDGHGLMDLPYDERRARLEALAIEDSHVAVPPAYNDVAGTDVLRASREQGLEGVVAKRRTSPYRSGKRSRDWLKVKNFRTQEVVIGGYTEGAGRRRGSIGALLLGVPEDRRLRYVGKVGTGFSGEDLDALDRLLAGLRRTTSPFATPLPRSDEMAASWVRPSQVGEVRFSEWTADGRLRQPSWRGLRPDKRADDVRVED
ncbi:MAG TPA: non-homologous end-joining DNA ligase [Acidimicrobiales bacterium]|nr:non-homologous end-joining DNA ligase [Acidimicrobiales bacterium]